MSHSKYCCISREYAKGELYVQESEKGLMLKRRACEIWRWKVVKEKRKLYEEIVLNLMVKCTLSYF